MGVWGKTKYFYGLGDDQIDDFIEGIGFKSICKGHAKWFESGNKKYLYINSGEFGVNRGRTKIGQAKRPNKKVCAELRKWQKSATTTFILVGYNNFHAWCVNGQIKRGGPATTNLRNWEGHVGLLVIEDGKDWEYYDGQLHEGVSKYKHWAWKAVRLVLQRAIRTSLGFQHSTIKAKRFADRVDIEHACTAPILFVIDGMIRKKNVDPYKTPSVLPRFVDRMCDVLKSMGHTDMCGNVPWDELSEM